MLEDIRAYQPITPLLATSGQPTEAQIKAIARAGFEVVVNLGLNDAEYALPDEASSVAQTGMDYVHLAVPWTAPNREHFEQFCAAMQTNAGRKIYVHCVANMRTSVFVALYRSIYLGELRAYTFAKVQQIWSPNERWQKFIESVFADSAPMVRREDPGDERFIHQVVAAAFGRNDEAQVVARLRAAEMLPVSWVAVRAGELVGHVACSPVTLTPPNARWNGVGLGPLAVQPEQQRQGLGDKLVRAALQDSREQGFSTCVVLGSPAYYTRFGFGIASAMGLRNTYGVDAEFMAQTLCLM
ncbi:MAG: hypothetical protein OHK0052_27520 [Anaerolineales bacterium]